MCIFQKFTKNGLLFLLFQLYTVGILYEIFFRRYLLQNILESLSWVSKMAVKLFIVFVYGDSVDNTAVENSNVFCLIQMH